METIFFVFYLNLTHNTFEKFHPQSPLLLVLEMVVIRKYKTAIKTSFNGDSPERTKFQTAFNQKFQHF